MALTEAQRRGEKASEVCLAQGFSGSSLLPYVRNFAGSVRALHG